ncbi:MAG TPA: hypothetical protein VM848_02345 [Acidimicrobiia bacterium]|nr:hypothetical protein [Acidimicrobiia bacterium]
MPRSWPSTDAEPTGGPVELEDQAPDRRSRPSIEVEVIDLDPVRSVSIPRRDPAEGRRGWLMWIAIGVLVMGGLALLPGETVEPTSTTSDQALPEPESATTSTPLPAVSQAVVSDETFSLIPAAGLDGFIQFAGPIEFDGRYWIAGNSPYPSSRVSILSSVDGARWEEESILSSEAGSWLRVDDLDSFGGVLMAVGTAGQIDGPAYAPGRAGDLVLWKSPNGAQWSSLSIVDDSGVEFGGLQLTTSPEEVLITGQRRNAFDPSVLAQIPPELGPGLERGDFTFWNDYSSLRIVAPPGIELFRMSITQPVPTASTSSILLRSDNLIIWEDLPVTFASWNVATTLDGGFVSNALGGSVMYSSDGRSWDRTDRFPPLFYQSWGDRLVGVDYSVIHPNLIVVDGEATATIDLPPDISTSEFRVSITPGASGLATILGTYENSTAEPITRIDGYLLALDHGLLRIEEPSGETSYAHFGGDGLIGGTYLSETDSIQFENSDGSRTFEFPTAVFLDLRHRVVTGVFDVFLSRDGLEWARPQTGLRAAYADILGGAGDTFLVALHNYGRDYQEMPITVYRTGPIG